MEKTLRDKHNSRKSQRLKSKSKEDNEVEGRKTKEADQAERRRVNYHVECFKENNATDRKSKSQKDTKYSPERKREKDSEKERSRKNDKRISNEKSRKIVELDQETFSASREQKKCSRMNEERTGNKESKIRDRTNSDETVEKRKHGKGRRRASDDTHRVRRHQREGKSRKSNKDSSQDDSPEDTRKCYSDSEIDQTRNNITEQDSGSGDTKNMNISTMYKLFYKEEIENRKNKEGTSKNDGRDARKHNKMSLEEATASDQSSIRGKLIRVLFKKVKELLKETEKLRDERKEFVEQIEELSRQVAGLKLRETDHVSMKSKINDRLNVMVNDHNISDRGTSFREEVQGILNDIQTKYVTHWQNHERNMQEVQTEAETQIQTLMSSVVGKYVKISELHSGAISSVKENNHGSLNFSSSTLANDDKFEKKPKHILGRSKHIPSTFPSDYMRPLYVDTGIEHYGSETSDAHSFQNRTAELSGTLPDTTSQNLLKIADITTKPSVQRRSHCPQKDKQMREETKTKEELKEFWRHKLLKPNPLETLRREQKLFRNASDSKSQDDKNMTSLYTSRNQY